MAFRQPTAAPQRQLLAVDTESNTPRAELSPLSGPIDDSKEWVLFSPTQARSASVLSTERTPQTVGLSRLSDFGSWTVARSGQDDDAGLPGVMEDGDELDSLDDGLQAFREPNFLPHGARIDQSGGSILPAHDGLGTFAASSHAVQEQLYGFERFNLHRKHSYGHHRTASSVHRRLGALEEDESDSGEFLDKTRRDRIEKWRLDSSKIVMEEIQKERRAERSDTTVLEDGLDLTGVSRTKPGNGDADDSPTPTPPESESLWQRITRRVMKDLIGIDDNMLAVILGECLPDDSSLSKTPTQHSTAFPTETDFSSPQQPSSARREEGWEDRLLRRLAKELGLIAQYLTGNSPMAADPNAATTMDYAGIPVGASSSASKIPTRPARISTTTTTTPYTKPSARISQSTLSVPFRPTVGNRRIPHANLPRPGTRGTDLEALDEEEEAAKAEIAEIEYWERTPDLKSVMSYLGQRFISSRRRQSNASNGNNATSGSYRAGSVNRRTTSSYHSMGGVEAPAVSTTTTTTMRSATAAKATREPDSIATTHTEASLNRAAIIRMHHPLMGARSQRQQQQPPQQQHHGRGHVRSNSQGLPSLTSAALANNALVASSGNRRRGSLRLSGALSAKAASVITAGEKQAPHSPALKRAGTSCASWSSKRQRGLGMGMGSEAGSRNYWDIGIGGSTIGSDVAALGGVWGEV